VADLLKELTQARPDTLFVLCGLAFLAVAVLGNISGKIQPGKEGRIASGVLGPVLIIVGLWMHTGHTPPDEGVDKTSAIGSATAIRSERNDTPPSQTAPSPKFSLVGTWTGSPDCPMVFYKDDAKNIEGSCDNTGFIHRFAGTYRDPSNINITITRTDRKTTCETRVTGSIRIVGTDHIEVSQASWNGCGAATGPLTTAFRRSPG